jgi:histidyl-tRNA synthetase
MPSKPTIPKGTRDFSPEEMIKRDYIFDTIKQIFRLYGYQPIETPAMENISTLLGKYGEEGDKLLFRILNSGNFLSGITDDELEKRDSTVLSSRFCEKGLRYDLTVPFARYVVQHQHEIVFPFRRYQIQPVWRADRPQKGRYREFFQCDVDVIGSDSLLNEYELVRIIDDVFKRLEIAVVIKINNRKVLSGITEIAGLADRFSDITIAIDKIEKTGIKNAFDELISRGIPKRSIDLLQPVLNLKGSPEEKTNTLEELLSSSVTGLKGVSELKTLFGFIRMDPLDCDIELDLTLARGLDYYTGAIIEVKALDGDIGSLCGGGRYDDLTGIFGLEGVSGVGVSFGADRIYDILISHNQIESHKYKGTEVLVVNFGNEALSYGLRLLAKLHELGISSEIYPDFSKMKKQLSYANTRKIPYVLIAGEDEIRGNEVLVKIMNTGEQKKIRTGDLKSFFSQLSGD